METTTKVFVIIPKGLIKMELIKSPSINRRVDLMEPQAGHGIPVAFLNKQIVRPCNESIKL